MTSLHWLHGDLFGENLLVRDGRLVAVLDFGGPWGGDPTADLAVARDLAPRTRLGASDRSDDPSVLLGCLSYGRHWSA